MQWCCFTCNNINKTKEYKKQIYDQDMNKRYCSKCRRLDVLSFVKSDERVAFLKKKYIEINKFIDTIPISYTAIPYYYISYDIVLECVSLLDDQILNYWSMNTMIDFIRSRLHYKTYNSWQKYRRNLCNKRYKQLILIKFLPVLSYRPSNEICKFL